MTRFLRLATGDTLIETMQDGARRRHVVVRRLRSAYVLRSNDERGERTWTDDDLWDRHVRGALEHFAADLTQLDAKIVNVLEAAFESWPKQLQFRAHCKEQYCLYVDQLHRRGVRLMAAYERAAKTIFRRNRERWTLLANRQEGERAAERRLRARKGVSVIEEQENDKLVVTLDQPSLYTVRLWHQRWVSAGRVIEVLIDRYHDRGDFKPKKMSKLDVQQDESRPLCVYGAMGWIAKSVYMKMPRVPVMHAYRQLKALCTDRGIDCISHTTFYAFIRRYYTDYEEYKARHGWKAAYYRFKLFSRREAPSTLLEEVEVDHTLLDVFVRDPNGRVGRPWLTLLLCRATRCVVGIHIGFDVPSYATLQRALIHAISPKDVSALGLKHDWPCSGVMGAVITDRGLEFLCESFVAAGRRIGFAIVNLPGRCPHLKGAVERFFGSINVRVLSYIDGTTISRTPQHYDPEAKARFSLADLTHRIVEWVVDHYHQEAHEALGCAPAARWAELEATQGIPPANFHLLVILLGERVNRKVINTGIHWEGRTYKSDELEKLRKQRGGLNKDWEIRCDPYDRGEVWVLDDTIKVARWIVVPAVHQRTARGITRFQARTHLRVGRQLVPKGEPLTDAVMEEAKSLADAEAASGVGRQVLRYSADGALATPVVGGMSIPVILGSAPAQRGEAGSVGGSSGAPGDDRPTQVREAAASAGAASATDLATASDEDAEASERLQTLLDELLQV
ncbi:Mu transposase C-terminal domain-containing protein [Glacieibacterium frigidum]|uniref:DDE-type integrase/transposase/recombinase n=1 Tax=Glacieibacterium frigidum TaxID=2593303 RepID=A0A552UAB0_9SPHN|nr:Mu transposase C-terminal domain-containing protein [Glacieibacterium frigidum]TRW15143.1 DDE-type integrase/transposase/recombinase [Glacieibacterium frigidum]